MSLYSYFEQKLNRPDLGLLALRVVFGTLILLAGVGKLLDIDHLGDIGGAMAKFGVPGNPKLWGLLCALTETFGGLFVLLGILFRPAALLLVFNMIVACVFMWGAGPDFSSYGAFEGFMMQKIGTPGVYLAAFLGLLFTGPGKYAIHKGSGGGKSDK